MKLIKKLFFVGLFLGACSAFAGTMGPATPPAPYLPWSVIGSVGVGDIHFDGTIGIGRLAIAREMSRCDWASIGLEIGVQQDWKGGFTRRIPFDRFDDGTFFDVRINPMVDFLFTGKFNPWENHRVFLQTKGGVVVRNWELPSRFFVDNRSVTDLAWEGQVGLGYAFTDCISLSISYQGIARANWFGGRKATITQQFPAQNAGLLGLAYSF